MQIKITSQNESVVLKHAQGLDAHAVAAMELGLREGLMAVSADAQRNFILSGPRVRGELGPGARLHSRSGALGKSINTSVERKPDRVRGAIGSVLKYAAFHEFGFHAIMNVKAHTRVMKQFTDDPDWGGLEIDTRRVWSDQSGNFLGFRDTRKRAARSQKKGFVIVQFVRAHQRKVDYPGKPYIRPALERADIAGRIKTELDKL